MFSGSNSAAARSARAIIGRLPILCRTLAWLLFILVPRPAARINTLTGFFTASSSGKSTTKIRRTRRKTRKKLRALRFFAVDFHWFIHVAVATLTTPSYDGENPPLL